MTELKSDFLRIAKERGYLYQCTDYEALDRKLTSGEPLTAYVGYDCTADSLHIGSLVSIMLLRLFQKTGNQPITLMGGGTTRVGDPSGKDESRQLITLEKIEQNKRGIQSIFEQFIDFGDSPTGAIMVDNAEWLAHLNYIDFLRDYGRHFTVNRMLSFDSVKLRLEREQPLSFLEFNYMILQAYDFHELAKRYGCALQMGGSDQWGNIVNGMELGRRVSGFELYGLTVPLMTTASGAKMGKSADGAVWLNEERLSAFDYWQFWRNTEDADVGRFLRIFTELPLDEIAKLEALGGAEINEAKKILADEATRLCRGEEAAARAAETAKTTFEQGGLAADLPTVEISAAEVAEGPALFALMTRAGLTPSNGEARRMIKGGGARLNDQPIASDAVKLSANDFADGLAKLSAGKKKHALLKLTD